MLVRRTDPRAMLLNAVLITLLIASLLGASSASAAEPTLTDQIDHGSQHPTTGSIQLPFPATEVCFVPQPSEPGAANRYDLTLTQGDQVQQVAGSTDDPPACVRGFQTGRITTSLVASAGKPGSSVSLTPSFNTPAARWEEAGRLLIARTEHTATALEDGRVLVTGGFSDTKRITLVETEIFDPTNGTSTAVGDMNIPRYGHEATLLQDGRVLVTGGQVLPGVSAPLAEIFDPQTGEWTIAGPTRERHDHAALLLDSGKVLIAGGKTNYPYGGATTADLFDPESGTFTPVPTAPMPIPGGTTAQLEDGRIMFLGDNEKETRGVIYSPADQSWELTPPLSFRAVEGELTPLADGRVLVTGGHNFGDYLKRAELYDPASNTWSITASMNQGRAHHGTLRQDDGTILAVGGHYSGGLVRDSSVELYDPAAEAWSLGNELLVPRTAHRALLVNGTVLVIGGYGRDGKTPVIERLSP